MQNSDYEITSKYHINRVRFPKVGEDENRDEIVIRSRGQMTSWGPQDVQLQGRSGIQEASNFRGYNEMGFPFTGRVFIQLPKQQHDIITATAATESESITTTVRAFVNFVIKTPGRWIVNIYY